MGAMGAVLKFMTPDRGLRKKYAKIFLRFLQNYSILKRF